MDGSGLSTGESVYQRLVNDLVHCRFRPGQTVFAGEIAQAYGVSKTPVREGLIRLANEGYVIVRPRSGYLVAPIRLADVEHLFQMRILLEPPAAELAATRRTVAQLTEIRRLAALNDHLDRTRPARRPAADPETDRLTANTAFHLAIATAAGNERLLRVVGALLREVERLYRLGIQLDEADHWLRAINRHVSLSDAIESHDSALARTIMTEAILTSRARLLNALKSATTPDSEPALPGTMMIEE